AFSMGLRDGKFEIGGPVGLAVKESLIESVQGVSFGATGLVLAHQAKVIVGIGRFGFVAGPYTALDSSVGISRGSDLGIVVCSAATLTMRMLAGVGYVMPQPAVKAINFFLRQLNLGQIKGSGGLQT